MSDHFADIGFRFASRDEWTSTMMGAVINAAVPDTGPLATRLLWSDPSGARWAYFTEEKQIICAKPSFAGQSRVSVQVQRQADAKDGCPMCAVSVVDVVDNGVMATMAGVELDDQHLGPLGEEGTAVELAITAFGEQVTRFADVPAYQNARTDGSASAFAERSFIPSGLFAPGGKPKPTTAHAIMNGIVQRAERRTNTLTGNAFDWALLESYPTAYDIVIAADGEPLASGEVVQGSFWLVGHRLPPGG